MATLLATAAKCYSQNHLTVSAKLRNCFTGRLNESHLSTASNFFSNFSSVDAICKSCTFSSLPLGCVHSKHLNNPANENSIEPSSSLLFTPWRKPSKDFCFAFFFASSASFFSSSISYKSMQHLVPKTFCYSTSTAIWTQWRLLF